MNLSEISVKDSDTIVLRIPGKRDFSAKISLKGSELHIVYTTFSGQPKSFKTLDDFVSFVSPVSAKKEKSELLDLILVDGKKLVNSNSDGVLAGSSSNTAPPKPITTARSRTPSAVATRTIQEKPTVKSRSTTPSFQAKTQLTGKLHATADAHPAAPKTDSKAPAHSTKSAYSSLQIPIPSHTGASSAGKKLPSAPIGTAPPSLSSTSRLAKPAATATSAPPTSTTGPYATVSTPFKPRGVTRPSSVTPKPSAPPPATTSTSNSLKTTLQSKSRSLASTFHTTKTSSATASSTHLPKDIREEHTPALHLEPPSAEDLPPPPPPPPPPQPKQEPITPHHHSAPPALSHENHQILQPPRASSQQGDEPSFASFHNPHGYLDTSSEASQTFDQDLHNPRSMFGIDQEYVTNLSTQLQSAEAKCLALQMECHSKQEELELAQAHAAMLQKEREDTFTTLHQQRAKIAELTTKVFEAQQETELAKEVAEMNKQEASSRSVEIATLRLTTRQAQESSDACIRELSSLLDTLVSECAVLSTRLSEPIPQTVVHVSTARDQAIEIRGRPLSRPRRGSSAAPSPAPTPHHNSSSHQLQHPAHGYHLQPSPLQTPTGDPHRPPPIALELHSPVQQQSPKGTTPLASSTTADQRAKFEIIRTPHSESENSDKNPVTATQNIQQDSEQNQEDQNIQDSLEEEDGNESALLMEELQQKLEEQAREVSDLSSQLLAAKLEAVMAAESHTQEAVKMRETIERITKERNTERARLHDAMEELQRDYEKENKNTSEQLRNSQVELSSALQRHVIEITKRDVEIAECKRAIDDLERSLDARENEINDLRESAASEVRAAKTAAEREIAALRLTSEHELSMVKTEWEREITVTKEVVERNKISVQLECEKEKEQALQSLKAQLEQVIASKEKAISEKEAELAALSTRRLNFFRTVADSAQKHGFQLAAAECASVQIPSSPADENDVLAKIQTIFSVIQTKVETQLRILESERDQAREAIFASHKTRDATEWHVTALQNELGTLRDGKETLVKALTDAQEEARRLVGEISKLSNENQMLWFERKRLETERVVQESECGRLSAELRLVQSSKGRLEADKQHLEDQNRQLAEAKSVLETITKNLEKEFADLTLQNEQSRVLMEELRGQVSEGAEEAARLEKECFKLRDASTQSANERDQAKKELEILRDKLITSDSTLDQQKSLIGEMRRKLKTQEAELSWLTGVVSDSTRELAELKVEHAAKMDDLAVAQRKLARLEPYATSGRTLERTITDLQEQLSTAQKTIDQLREGAEKERDRAEVFAFENKDLGAKVVALQVQAGEERKRAQEVEEALSALRNELTQMESDLTIARSVSKKLLLSEDWAECENEKLAWMIESLRAEQAQAIADATAAADSEWVPILIQLVAQLTIIRNHASNTERDFASLRRTFKRTVARSQQVKKVARGLRLARDNCGSLAGQVRSVVVRALRHETFPPPLPPSCLQPLRPMEFEPIPEQTSAQDSTRQLFPPTTSHSSVLSPINIDLANSTLPLDQAIPLPLLMSVVDTQSEGVQISGTPKDQSRPEPEIDLENMSPDSLAKFLSNARNNARFWTALDATDRTTLVRRIEESELAVDSLASRLEELEEEEFYKSLRTPTGPRTPKQASTPPESAVKSALRRIRGLSGDGPSAPPSPSGLGVPIELPISPAEAMHSLGAVFPNLAVSLEQKLAVAQQQQAPALASTPTGSESALNLTENPVPLFSTPQIHKSPFMSEIYEADRLREIMGTAKTQRDAAGTPSFLGDHHVDGPTAIASGETNENGASSNSFLFTPRFVDLSAITGSSVHNPPPELDFDPNEVTFLSTILAEDDELFQSVYLKRQQHKQLRESRSECSPLPTSLSSLSFGSMAPRAIFPPASNMFHLATSVASSVTSSVRGDSDSEHITDSETSSQEDHESPASSPRRFESSGQNSIRLQDLEHQEDGDLLSENQFKTESDVSSEGDSEGEEDADVRREEESALNEMGFGSVEGGDGVAVGEELTDGSGGGIGIGDSNWSVAAMGFLDPDELDLTSQLESAMAESDELLLTVATAASEVNSMNDTSEDILAPMDIDLEALAFDSLAESSALNNEGDTDDPSQLSFEVTEVVSTPGNVFVSREEVSAPPPVIIRRRGNSNPPNEQAPMAQQQLNDGEIVPRRKTSILKDSRAPFAPPMPDAGSGAVRKKVMFGEPQIFSLETFSDFPHSQYESDFEPEGAPPPTPRGVISDPGIYDPTSYRYRPTRPVGLGSSTKRRSHLDDEFRNAISGLGVLKASGGLSAEKEEEKQQPKFGLVSFDDDSNPIAVEATAAAVQEQPATISPLSPSQPPKVIVKKKTLVLKLGRLSGGTSFRRRLPKFRKRRKQQSQEDNGVMEKVGAILEHCEWLPEVFEIPGAGAMTKEQILEIFSEEHDAQVSTLFGPKTPKMSSALVLLSLANKLDEMTHKDWQMSVECATCVDRFFSVRNEMAVPSLEPSESERLKREMLDVAAQFKSLGDTLQSSGSSSAVLASIVSQLIEERSGA